MDEVDEDREKAYKTAIYISFTVALLPLIILIGALPLIYRQKNFFQQKFRNDLSLCEEIASNYYDFSNIDFTNIESDVEKLKMVIDLIDDFKCVTQPDACDFSEQSRHDNLHSYLTENVFKVKSNIARHRLTRATQYSEPQVTSTAFDNFISSGSLHHHRRTNDQNDHASSFVTDTTDLLTSTLASTHDECKCNPIPGAKGLPGRKGMKGAPGAPGAPGLPARLPCQPPIDLQKICADPCPVGVQGKQGSSGLPGKKGSSGLPGKRGKDGDHGKTGPPGSRGPPGVPGLDGDMGDPGTDASPAPFIAGPAGAAGDAGPIGPPGPRGMPGIDGPPGPPGKRGQSGENGESGKKGSIGMPGPIGKVGLKGEAGICPTYCATDGGVFFVKPPEWLEQ